MCAPIFATTDAPFFLSCYIQLHQLFFYRCGRLSWLSIIIADKTITCTLRSNEIKRFVQATCDTNQVSCGHNIFVSDNFYVHNFNLLLPTF